MSKTYNSDLQSNNERIQALINKANSLPEAGGGGGSVETCTVIINNNTSYGNNVYKAFFNVLTPAGNLDIQSYNGGNSETFSNVICGSIISINNMTQYGECSASYNNIQTIDSTCCIQAPTTSNTTGTITIQ